MNLMHLESKLREIIKKIHLLHPEDPKVYEYWDAMTRYLTQDKAQTIEFVNNIESAELASEISSVFDDVASIFQDENFIAALELLQNKFPEENLEHMINAAKNNMY